MPPGQLAGDIRLIEQTFSKKRMQRKPGFDSNELTLCLHRFIGLPMKHGLPKVFVDFNPVIIDDRVRPEAYLYWDRYSCFGRKLDKVAAARERLQLSNLVFKSGNSEQTK